GAAALATGLGRAPVHSRVALHCWRLAGGVDRAGGVTAQVGAARVATGAAPVSGAGQRSVLARGPVTTGRHRDRGERRESASRSSRTRRAPNLTRRAAHDREDAAAWSA